MGAGHAHALYVHEHSPTHHLAPEAKVVAAFGMVVCIALTPRQAVWAFGVYVVLILGLIVLSRLSPWFVLVRLSAVIPFVVFALFIPFIGTGPTVPVLGVDLSVEGLWGAWNILVKAVLGASISIVLTATTEIPDLIRGLGILRVPVVFTSITTFMVRYLELISDELSRMRVAMTARGYDPRWITQARPIASSAGALFVRSYERGERIHSAMLSRGFTGEMPVLVHTHVGVAGWVAVAGLVGVFATVTALALVLT